VQARSAALAEARARARAQIEKDKAAIEKDKLTAQAGLEAESGRLAAEIIRTVLLPVRVQVPAVGR
ncbi:MAG TPA: hypothetical protein VGU64_16175, partial [Terriglobales bacterium]|nr:hypothetical protein [Terriglobales bacterium]